MSTPQTKGNGLGVYPTQVDLTKDADRQLRVLDEPQILAPGIHGAMTPLSLRSNRVDNYTSLQVEVCNALSFAKGISAKLIDVTTWLASGSFIFAALKWGLPYSGLWWLPYVVYSLLGLSILAMFVSACVYRRSMIPFAILRTVLIGISYTLVM